MVFINSLLGLILLYCDVRSQGGFLETPPRRHTIIYFMMERRNLGKQSLWVFRQFLTYILRMSWNSTDSTDELELCPPRQKSSHLNFFRHAGLNLHDLSFFPVILRLVKGAFQTKSFYNSSLKCGYFSILHTQVTVRKHNNLTTSVTLLDELPVSDLFFTDKEPGIFPIYDNTRTL